MLTELRDAQVAGETLFLGVSVRVLKEEMSIWIRLSDNHPHRCRWALPILLKTCISRRPKKGKFTLCLSWDTHLLLPPDTDAPDSWAFGFWPGLVALRPDFQALDVEWITHMAFLVHQLADGRSWVFWASIIMWALSLHKSHMYVHISYRFCVSGEPWHSNHRANVINSITILINQEIND